MTFNGISCPPQGQIPKKPFPTAVSPSLTCTARTVSAKCLALRFSSLILSCTESGLRISRAPTPPGPAESVACSRVPCLAVAGHSWLLFFNASEN